MKRTLLFLALPFLLFCGTLSAQLSIVSSVGSSTCNASFSYLCINGPVSGATSYSWSVSTPTSCAGTFSSTSTGTCVLLLMPCANQYYISVSAMNGTTQVSSATYTITRLNSPVITITASSNTICAGNTVTLTASGANSYTWYPGNTASPTIAVTPAASTAYTVLGTNGCYGSDQIFITVQNSGSLSVSAPNLVCAGTAATLSVSGANTYTWLPMNTTGQFVSVPSLSPGAHCFTVTGTNACGQVSATKCLTVNPQPTITVTSSGGPVCPGQAYTVTASGVNSYYWALSGGGSYSTSTIVHTPYTPFSFAVLYGTSGPCTASTTVTFSMISFPVTQSHTLICSGQSATLSALSSANHTWTSGSGVISTASSVVVSPTVTTTYTVSGMAGSCLVSNVITVNVSVFALSLTGPSTVCAGNSAFLVASGASGYSWTPPASATGSVAIVYPSTNTCYTVLGWTGSCVGTAVHCVSVNPAASLAITPSQTICPGDTAVIAGGAGTYTFYYSTLTPPYVSGTSVGNQFLVTPSVTTGYSVSSVSSSGCGNYFTATVTVASPVNPQIFGNASICAGSTTTLLASGLSTYTWSTGSTGPLLVVTPSATACYSLFGVNSAGCMGTAVKCVTVNSTAVTIAASNQSVCEGTSATFTASGANTYTWNTAANTATLNVLPSVTTSYTVSGTGGNGCIGTATVALVVDTTCSDVWPGDANSDGIVSTTDVLELGYAASSTGASRSGASNNYAAQHCSNWAGTVSSGKNKCHADCNGDGTVDADDTLAIFNNFGLSHAFRESGKGTHKIRLSGPSAIVSAGSWATMEVYLGDPTDNYTNVYGVTFDLLFEQQKIDAAYLEYNQSFLNASNVNIDFRKMDLPGGMVYAATVRTDHNNVSGSGHIATFHFKTKSTLADNTVLNFSLAGSNLADNSGNLESLTTEGDQVTIGTGVGIDNAAYRTPLIYPNPAQAFLVIEAGESQHFRYTISDLSGRMVAEGEGSRKATVSTTELAEGTYLLGISSGGNTWHKKIVIGH